ncbi:MAG: glycine--tRNA ligase, partial [Planctomycetota bacterium]
MAVAASTMDKIVALCKRRGFIFQSSEIYGGIGGFWDYGPLGTELKRNIKDAWWNDMVRNHPPGPEGREYQMVGLDCSIIMNPKVWEASGHVGGFNDPMVDCRECKVRFRADQLVPMYLIPTSCDPTTLTPDEAISLMNSHPSQAVLRWLGEIGEYEAGRDPEPRDRFIKKNIKAKTLSFRRAVRVSPWNVTFLITDDGRRFYLHTTPVGSDVVRDGDPCPRCTKGVKAVGSLTEPREFNLMFQTHVGAMQDASSIAYLRPETAQGIFANFKNVLDSTRVRLPLGIAQIGKSFRNEINPRNYTFRSREFEQYEIEFFCHSSEAAMWYEYWRDLRHQWYVGLGLESDKLRLRDHEADELAHYAETCADVEYDFPFGLSELEGIANRTDFDLKAHIEKSGKDLSYFDAERKERYVPYVIEPSGGVDRSVLAFITEAYTVDENRASPEFMNFHP